MKNRNYIRSQIIQAWSDCIETDYSNQRINSERGLQASIWSRLNHLLPKNRRLFIEPTISINTDNGIKKLIPDIVICNSKEVISVIELKYLPRGQPKYTKDIETLSMVADNKHLISITNDRFRGAEQDAYKYEVSKDVLFVWAGIHAKEKSAPNQLYSHGHPSLNGCFIELHAVTELDKRPEIYYRN